MRHVPCVRAQESHRKNLNQNSAFNATERAAERAKVERNLSVRMAAVYKPPSEAWLQSYVVPTPDPPLDLSGPIAPA